MKKIARALISVNDKTGIQELGNFLAKRGVEIVATSGTSRVLEKSGVKTVEVTSVTGMSEFLDGRVKSMHPAILVPILAKRSEAGHIDHLKPFGGKTIDLVIVNFLPFETVSAAPETTLQASLNSIDVGGPALARAAAKNHGDVVVLTSPAQYAGFMEEFTKMNGTVSEDSAKKYALAAFERTAAYDIVVYDYLFRKFQPEEAFPETLFLRMTKAFNLRCGENPHQKASFYRNPGYPGLSLADLTVLKGKPLSYNNMVDIHTALDIVMEFDKCTVAVVRHGAPIGVCIDKDPVRAFIKAREADPSSAYGATVAFNTQLEKKAAKELTDKFVDIVVSPKYTEGAVEHIKRDKKAANMRVLQIAPRKPSPETSRNDLLSVLGGVLAQEHDEYLLPPGGQLKVLSKRKPTRKQLADMILAWKICKHVRSNAAVLVRDLQTVGIGSGNISRMDAVKLALQKAGDNAEGACLASDSFIAARSIMDEAARVGVVGVIEPGGAPNDDEVVMAADEHNLAIAFTGIRHYCR